jgi:hypothetical protein
MLFFTLAPLAAILASATLTLRRSPSGPSADAQLPFLGVSNLQQGAGSYAVTGLFVVPNQLEVMTQYMLPTRGVLRSLLVKNARVGDDAVELTYRVRVNEKDVGLLTVPNDSGEVFKINITQVTVNEGDLVSLLVQSPGFSGAPPVSKIVLLWRPLG